MTSGLLPLERFAAGKPPHEPPPFFEVSFPDLTFELFLSGSHHAAQSESGGPARDQAARALCSVLYFPSRLARVPLVDSTNGAGCTRGDFLDQHSHRNRLQ